MDKKLDDYKDVIQYLNRQQLESVTHKKRRPSNMLPIQYWSESIVQIKDRTRDSKEYVSVLEDHA